MIDFLGFGGPVKIDVVFEMVVEIDFISVSGVDPI